MGDLIDRKKALDEISKIDTSIIPSGWVKGYVDETIKETQRIIRTLPSAKPERKWIPVTEALPEEDIDVLLQFPKNMGVGYQEDGFWNIVTGNDMYCGLDEEEAKPIAWMPLPEPYRGE